MVTFLALLQVEMRMIRFMRSKHSSFWGGLISAQSGSAARQNRKPSFNERWNTLISAKRHVLCRCRKHKVMALIIDDAPQNGSTTWFQQVGASISGHSIARQLAQQCLR
jgi:hypothetical protein